MKLFYKILFFLLAIFYTNISEANVVVINAVTGANQLWYGESQSTLLHQGVRETSMALGASEGTAEYVAAGADISTIALGSIGSVKNFTVSYQASKLTLASKTTVIAEDVVKGENIVAKEGVKLYSDATFKAFERQLTNDGMKSILKTQTRIQKNLAEHMQKLVDIQNAGGYSSSVEREIRTFEAQLDAIKNLLK
jgi:hypothetical protein